MLSSLNSYLTENAAYRSYIYIYIYTYILMNADVAMYVHTSTSKVCVSFVRLTKTRICEIILLKVVNKIFRKFVRWETRCSVDLLFLFSKTGDLWLEASGIM
jgi:hypothetical protein